MNAWFFFFLWTATVRVWVQPQTIALAPGDSVPIQVELEADGVAQPVESPSRFEVLPPRLGTVRNGWFIARKSGVGVLRAVVSYQGREYAGHAALQISPRADRLRILLDPLEATIRPGGTLTFHARVLSPEGTELSAPLSFKVVPPWLGTVDPKGTFRAGDVPGEGYLVAWTEVEDRKGLARAKIRVLAPRAPKIPLRIEPRAFTVTPEETLAFRIWTPHVSPEDRTLEFFLDPPDLGQVTEGQFIAGPQPGRGMLWVYMRTSDGRTGMARVPVVIAEEERLPRVEIEPRRLHLRPRESTTVRLRAQNLPPRLRRLAPKLHWEVRPKVLAKILGPPDRPEIEILARRTGVGLVIAKIGRRPIAAVPLIVGKAIALQVEPREVHVGETFRILSDSPAPLQFRVFPADQVDILGDGQFRALQPGPVWIFGVLPEKRGGGVLRVEILP